MTEPTNRSLLGTLRLSLRDEDTAPEPAPITRDEVAQLIAGELAQLMSAGIGTLRDMLQDRAAQPVRPVPADRYRTRTVWLTYADWTGGWGVPIVQLLANDPNRRAATVTLIGSGGNVVGLLLGQQVSPNTNAEQFSPGGELPAATVLPLNTLRLEASGPLWATVISGDGVSGGATFVTIVEELDLPAPG